jgi:hypothetical protein
MHIKFKYLNLKGRDSLEDVGLEGRIWILKDRVRWCGMDVSG